MLFAFDRQRKAILLLGGDKSRDCRGWYRTNIPIADDLFDEHQRAIEAATVAQRRETGSKTKFILDLSNAFCCTLRR